MKAEQDSTHPITTFSYVLHELQKRADNGNEFAYVSIIEPRVQRILTLTNHNRSGDNIFVEQIWKGIILKSGNYTYDAPHFDTLLNDISDNRTLVGFSRYYTSNPDLVKRLYEGWDLTPYDRDTFYTTNNWGYNTWNNYNENDEIDKNSEVNRKAKAIEEVKVK